MFLPNHEGATYGMGVYHPATLLVSAACTLAVAALLHLAVERPFLRLRERRAHVSAWAGAAAAGDGRAGAG